MSRANGMIGVGILTLLISAAYYSYGSYLETDALIGLSATLAVVSVGFILIGGLLTSGILALN